jgi:hypothetical protein
VRQLDEALDEKAGGQQGRCIMQKFGCSGREYVCVWLAGVTGACTAHERQAEDMSNATYAEADLCPKPEEAKMGHRERKQTTIIQRDDARMSTT